MFSPKEELSIVVLTNFPSGNVGQKSKKIAQILFGDTISKTEKSIKKHKTLKLSSAQLKKQEGYYWNDKKNYSRRIYLKNDTLRYFRSEKSEDAIIPITKNKFLLQTNSTAIKITFNISEANKTMSLDTGKDVEVFQKYTPKKPTLKEIKSYTGVFYSTELETTYTIFMEGEKLKWHHPRHGDFDIKILKKDILKGQWPFVTVKYIRGENNEITGIRVSNGRVKRALFEKQ